MTFRLFEHFFKQIKHSEGVFIVAFCFVAQPFFQWTLNHDPMYGIIFAGGVVLFSFADFVLIPMLKHVFKEATK